MDANGQITQMPKSSTILSTKQYIKTAIVRGTLIFVLILIVSVSITAIFYRNAAEDEWWRAMLTGLAIPAIISPPIIFSTIKRNIDTMKLMNKIRDMAYRDDLTGLYNRRAFMSEAEKMHRQNDFSDHNLTCMIVDIDHFKRINDKFGHAAGDTALKHVASAIKAAIPNGALLARLGGEEFAISARFDDMGKLDELAEGIRRSVATRPFQHDTHKIIITISIGVGIAYPDDTVSAMLSRADGALYDAKNDGRDRFAIAA